MATSSRFNTKFRNSVCFYPCILKECANAAVVLVCFTV